MHESRRRMTLLLLTIGTIACNTRPAVSGDEQPTTLEQARGQVDARGRITDKDLRQRSGWQTMHAFQWTIELERPAGSNEFVAVSKNQTFHHGDAFRLRFETATDLYVYVLVRNADKSETILLPEAAETVPLVRRGDRAFLPTPPDTFSFSPPAGTEQLRLVVATEVLPWVSSKRFWELENGEALSDEQQAVLNQLKSARSRSLGEAITKLSGQAKSVDSLRIAKKQIEQGTLAKGAEVIAVEDADEADVVCYVTNQTDAHPIIVHDITLNHAN